MTAYVTAYACMSDVPIVLVIVIVCTVRSTYACIV